MIKGEESDITSSCDIPLSTIGVNSGYDTYTGKLSTISFKSYLFSGVFSGDSWISSKSFLLSELFADIIAL